MALFTKIVKIPATEKVCTDYFKCDLCGDTTNDHQNWNGQSTYSIDETIIKMIVTRRSGDYYPDGGNSTTTYLDICPRCFDTRLIPWFKEQGGKPRTRDQDW